MNEYKFNFYLYIWEIQCVAGVRALNNPTRTLCQAYFLFTFCVGTISLLCSFQSWGGGRKRVQTQCSRGTGPCWLLPWTVSATMIAWSIALPSSNTDLPYLFLFQFRKNHKETLKSLTFCRKQTCHRSPYRTHRCNWKAATYFSPSDHNILFSTHYQFPRDRKLSFVCVVVPQGELGVFSFDFDLFSSPQ